MIFIITPIYAAILGIMFLILRTIVVVERVKTGISLQTNNNIVLVEKVRRFGNFIETVPLLLILMAFSESLGASVWSVHAIGGTLLASRILHPLGLSHQTASHPLRIISGILTMISAIFSSGSILWNAVS